jgi:hypothetical protein
MFAATIATATAIVDLAMTRDQPRQFCDQIAA